MVDEPQADPQAQAAGANPAPEPPWYESQLQDPENRVAAARDGYKTIDDAMKALRHAQSLVGLDKSVVLRLPKDRSAPGALDPIYQELGRPETPDYGLKPDAKAGLSENDVKGWSERFHKAGLNPQQVQVLMEGYLTDLAANGETVQRAVQQNRERTIAALKTEWGAAFDDRMQAIGAVIEAHGGQELRAFLNETGLGDDPRMIKFADAFAQAVGEAGLPAAQRGRVQDGRMTPAQAQARLREYEAANDKALMDRSHSDHKDVVAERNRLLAMAYPPASG